MHSASAPSTKAPPLIVELDTTALRAFCQHITDERGVLLDGYTMKTVVLPDHPNIFMAQFYHHEVYYATIPCYPTFNYGARGEA